MWGSFVLCGGIQSSYNFAKASVSGVINWITGLRVAQLTKENVVKKLENYLLNPDHTTGWSKAKWFKEALGFTQDNIQILARQVKFNPQSAIPTVLTQYGQKFEQIINITGANGRSIDVKFIWIQNLDKVIRLVTAFPGD